MLTRIVGLFGWLGTALVFAGVAVRFLKPEMPRVWNGLLLGGLGCMLVYILGQWRDIVRAFAGRQARFGALTAASVFIVLGILIGINYIADRQNKRWDLTASKQYSLSEQTAKVLQGLKEPVKIHVFERDENMERFRSRLNEYGYASKQVSVEYIDPDKKPAAANQFQVQSYGTVVIDYKGRIERVTSDSEQDITNAVIKAVQGQQKKVYFIQGHGEKDTASSERDGYNTVAGALGRDNFGVDKLVLLQQKGVPADASVLIVAGPKADFFPSEIDAIRVFLRKGGKLFVMVDPDDTGKAAPMPNLLALLKEWNVEFGNNIVVDMGLTAQVSGAGPVVPVVGPPYPAHPITERFRVATAFPLARSVDQVTGGNTSRTAQPFLETSADSFAETDLARLRSSSQVAFNEGVDKKGPITLGIAATGPAEDAPAPGGASGGADVKKPEGRVAVIGDSDFATNVYVRTFGNQDLFMNTVNWLAQQEDLIAIRPKDPEDRRISLTADQQRRIFLLSVFIIPGLVLGAGVRSWWKRR